MMNPTQLKQSADYQNIYAGIPHKQSIEMKRESSKQYLRGLWAFLVGLCLAAAAWICNQGWTIVSLLLFGPFKWTFEHAWRHLLFCSTGSICTAICWVTIFKFFFPGAYNEDDDDESEKKRNKSVFDSDVSDALQELGELGFILGYLGSQSIGMNFYQHLDLSLDESYQNIVNPFITVIVVAWILFTKAKDYVKAIHRADDIVESIASSRYHESGYMHMV
ncbi:hypothetical protein ACHAXS_001637 [Conticribra weissflogii]